MLNLVLDTSILKGLYSAKAQRVVDLLVENPNLTEAEIQAILDAKIREGSVEMCPLQGVKFYFLKLKK